MIIKHLLILLYNGYLEMRIGYIRCKMMVPERSFFSSEKTFYCFCLNINAVFKILQK